MIVERKPRARGKSHTLSLLLVGVVFCLGGFATLAIQHATEAEKTLATDMAAKAAAQRVTAFIQPTIANTIELAIALEKARANGDRRDNIRGLVVPRLQRHPENFGISVVFEPNDYDGKDAQFAGVAPEQNEEGRFAAYYYNNGEGPMAVDHLVMTIESGIAGWYLEPLVNKRARLETPYTYPIKGIDTLMTTISVPLLAEGRAFGVTTMDIRLPDFAETVRSLALNDVDTVALLNAAGTWIIHPDSARAGQDLLQSTDASVDLFGDALVAVAYRGYRKDSRPTIYRYSPEGTAVQYLLVPVTFAGVPEVWTLVFSMPVEGMTKSILAAMPLPLAIAVVAFILGAGLAANLMWGRQAARPHRVSTRHAPVVQQRRTQPTIQRR